MQKKYITNPFLDKVWEVAWSAHALSYMKENNQAKNSLLCKKLLALATKSAINVHTLPTSYVLSQFDNHTKHWTNQTELDWEGQLKPTEHEKKPTIQLE